MLPRDLQFELKPRRSLRWLRPAVAAACLLVAGVSALLLVPRQRELDRLRDELVRATQLLAAAQQPVPASAPVPAWQAAAEQDGRLFALQLEARLLEIERCTETRATVSRIVHDETSGTTTLELRTADAGELSPMLACFNSSGDRAHPWRLSNVEAIPGTAGATAAGQRATFARR